MATLDILIILGILFFMVLGFRDGFFKKIYGIIGFFAGFFVAAKFMYVVGQSFSDVLGLSKEFSHILAFCVVFLIFIVLENLFYRWFGTPGSEHQRFWSRVGGAVIGFFQGLIGMSMLLVMFSIVQLPSDATRNESTLYKMVYHFAPKAYDMTGTTENSKGFLEMLQENFRTIKLP